MQSISELRLQCQATRPAIFSDFLSRFYYWVSIYFTRGLIWVGLSANAVSLLSGITAVFGAVLLINDNMLARWCGLALLFLSAVLDMCDGEVARYHKTGSMNGHFMDWMIQFAISTAVMMAMFIECQYEIPHFLLPVALLAIIFPTFDKTITTSCWTVIAWAHLREKSSSSNSKSSNSFHSKVESVTRNRGKLRRFISTLIVSPTQDHWLPLILVFFEFLNILLSLFDAQFNYPLALLMYVGILGPLIAFRRVAKGVNGKFLQNGYQKLFDRRQQIKLPEDDFIL